MSKLRFGILGLGNIARQFAAGVGGAPGADRAVVAAGASRSADKARAFCGPLGIPHALDSYPALIKHPAVDAVYNALPNNLHAAWTVKALEHGKHVLCEKPIAMDAGEAAAMFDAARANGRLLVEAFMYRTHPQTAGVLDAIRAGTVGRVRLVRTSFCFSVRERAGNTRFDRALGGGSLMDIGCYCIDLAMLVAQAESARAGGDNAGSAVTAAHATGRLTEGGVDVAASGTLAFANGVRASFDCGMDLQASNLAQVCGEAGYLDIPVPWKPAVSGAVWHHRGMTGLKQDASKAGPGQAAAPFEHTHTAEAGRPLYALEADAFARAVLDGDRPFVTEDETLARMRVLDELRRQVGVRWD